MDDAVAQNPEGAPTAASSVVIAPSTETADEGAPAASAKVSLVRPHVWLKTLKFSDGTALEVGRDEIIVIVGPNNAGKSAALRETYQKLSSGPKSTGAVLTEVTFTFDGTEGDFEEWVANEGIKDRAGNLIVGFAGSFRAGSAGATWRNKDRNGLQSFTNLLAAHLNTEARLTATAPVDLINFATEAPTHPLHKLYDDDVLEARLSAIFARAFRQDLIVNRGAGRQVLLHLGKRPKPRPGQDRQSMEYRHAINDLPKVHEQGDGMRAFVGVLASVLVADRDIIFVDEPEAFLHPPQAYLLGKVLAEETPTGRQLVVSTHSSDFLRGVLDYSSPRVRVVRIQREDNVICGCGLNVEPYENAHCAPLPRIAWLHLGDRKQRLVRVMRLRPGFLLG